VTEKYALHPGYVSSKQDGDRHYIGIGQLVRLYELQPNEYVVWDKEGSCGRFWDDYVHLYPDYEGRYGRPNA
jgi:hypothetical protein